MPRDILCIRVEEVPAFLADYDLWCQSVPIENMIVEKERIQQAQPFNPFLTTNTSSPQSTFVLVAIFEDANGTYPAFLAAHPRWAKYEA
jgi:hypothetical protein